MTVQEPCVIIRMYKKLIPQGGEHVRVDDVLVSNIREIIDRQGVKQRAVAERAGIPAPLFYSMTSGRKKIPALAVSDIAKALGVTPNDLFGFESPAPTQPE